MKLTPRDPLDHPNSPVFFLEEVGDGWVRPALGEIVRTHWECLSMFPKVQWRLTAYFTAEGLVNDGRTHYRRANSLGAWYRVAKQLPRKWWRHYVKHEI